MSKPSVEIWMPLYIGDLLADTMHLSNEELGAYVRLTMHAWRHGGIIPSDKKTLKNVTQLSPKKRQKIMSFFVEKDGALHHERLKSLHSEAIENQEKRRKQTAAASAARWPAPQSVTDSVTDCATNPSSPLSLQSSLSLSPEYPPKFSEFLDAYPATDSTPEEAVLAYQKVLELGVSPDMLITAAQAYHEQLKRKEIKYLYHPKNWLEKELWRQNYKEPIDCGNLAVETDAW